MIYLNIFKLLVETYLKKKMATNLMLHAPYNIPIHQVEWDLHSPHTASPPAIERH